MRRQPAWNPAVLTAGRGSVHGSTCPHQPWSIDSGLGVLKGVAAAQSALLLPLVKAVASGRPGKQVGGSHWISQSAHSCTPLSDTVLLPSPRGCTEELLAPSLRLQCRSLCAGETARRGSTADCWDHVPVSMTNPEPWIVTVDPCQPAHPPPSSSPTFPSTPLTPALGSTCAFSFLAWLTRFCNFFVCLAFAPRRGTLTPLSGRAVTCPWC